VISYATSHSRGFCHVMGDIIPCCSKHVRLRAVITRKHLVTPKGGARSCSGRVSATSQGSHHASGCRGSITAVVQANTAPARSRAATRLPCEAHERAAALGCMGGMRQVAPPHAPATLATRSRISRPSLVSLVTRAASSSSTSLPVSCGKNARPTRVGQMCSVLVRSKTIPTAARESSSSVPRARCRASADCSWTARARSACCGQWSQVCLQPHT
jgi:hypothetical protein